jgi:glycosyltransferase involved in cell wall biosynthesis
MRMTLRVAAVLPSFAGGGAERVLLTLLAGLDRTQFSTDVVVLTGEGPLAELVPAGATVHDLRRPRLRQAIVALLSALRQIKPTVIVSTLGYVNLALLVMKPFLSRRPRLVLREANTPSRSLQTTPWPGLFRAAYRLLYPKADVVICPTKLIEEELRNDFGVSAARLHVLANPVDVACIRRAAAAPQRKPGAGLRFVAAGRLTSQKGFDRLLDMLPALPEDSHVTVYGEGTDRANLEAQAMRLGMQCKVTFAGFETSPWPYYAGADAFLLTSRWEGMPNAALEALACGTPVIATRESGGLLEVAGETRPGAVTVAEAGPPFVEAMGMVKPDPCTAPRPSLLPARFAVESTSEAFTVLLAQMPSSCAPPGRSR